MTILNFYFIFILTILLLQSCYFKLIIPCIGNIVLAWANKEFNASGISLYNKNMLKLKLRVKSIPAACTVFVQSTFNNLLCLNSKILYKVYFESLYLLIPLMWFKNIQLIFSSNSSYFIFILIIFKFLLIWLLDLKFLRIVS